MHLKYTQKNIQTGEMYTKLQNNVQNMNTGVGTWGLYNYDNGWTNWINADRIVVDLRTSPTEIRLYACHMSSDSSGIRTTHLQNITMARLIFTKSTILTSHN